MRGHQWLHARRRERGTCWQRLSADRQALHVLAHLRCGHTYAQLAAGFGVGTSTVYRYVVEAVDLLATRAPRPAHRPTHGRRQSLRHPGRNPEPPRVAADQPYHSGKHKKHGMNVQVLADRRVVCCGPHRRYLARSTTSAPPAPTASSTPWPRGTSPAGRTRPTRVLPAQRGCPTAAAGTGSPPASRPSTVPHAKIRALGEQAMATLQTWRPLRKLRCSTTRITGLVQAVLTLHLETTNGG